MEKLCVDLMGTYYIGIKLYKDDLNLKVVTTIDTVIGWSKITKYADKRAISITNLVETFLGPQTQVPRPVPSKRLVRLCR